MTAFLLEMHLFTKKNTRKENLIMLEYALEIINNHIFKT